MSMDSGFQFFDIILFAAVAGFLLFRLRGVLGRRTGAERRPPNPLVMPPAPVIAPPPIVGGAPVSGLTGIAALKAADPSFNEQAFLGGVRGAFDIILKAFAAGDTASLKPLLSTDVFGAFAEAIRARQAAKETHQTTVVGVKSVGIEQTTIEGTTALVTVKIVSDQINVTHDTDGKVVDGEPDKVVEKTDFWTLSRNLRARDPNWTLVATHSS
jgi:predicted lipid-binding transport protein (Tim44 family)